jgi:ketosteroid isomerase-like protein
MSNQNQRGRAEDKLLQIEKEIFSAIKSKDSKRLETILSDDFVYRSPENSAQQKAAFLKAIESISIEVTDVWSEDMKVNIYSDVAVITGTQKAKVRLAEGKVVIGATAFTDVFIRKDEKWLLALAHGVELPTTTSER